MDKQTQAVVDAIREKMSTLDGEIYDCHSDSIQEIAQTAIKASGAEHLGELVRVLTMLSKKPIATWYVGGDGKGYYAGWDDAEYFIQEALSKLPPELRAGIES